MWGGHRLPGHRSREYQCAVRTLRTHFDQFFPTLQEVDDCLEISIHMGEEFAVGCIPQAYPHDWRPTTFPHRFKGHKVVILGHEYSIVAHSMIPYLPVWSRSHAYIVNMLRLVTT